MTIFIKKLLFPFLIFALISVFFFYYVTEYTKTNSETNYVLKSYKNTVALYNNDEVVKIYSDIVLNTLPKNDIQNFNDGISVSDPQYAEQYLENFE